MITFDGFIRVYQEGTDDENAEQLDGQLPAVVEGDLLRSDEITATERFTKHVPRYTEASLVKKLEELGIGRPSTYAPTISTIQKRKYVLKNRLRANLDLSKSSVQRPMAWHRRGQRELRCG